MLQAPRIAEVLSRTWACEIIKQLSHGELPGTALDGLAEGSNMISDTRRDLREIGAIARRGEGQKAYWSLTAETWIKLIRAADALPVPDDIWNRLAQPGAFAVLIELLLHEELSPSTAKSRAASKAIPFLRAAGLIDVRELRLVPITALREFLTLVLILVKDQHCRAKLESAEREAEAAELLISALDLGSSDPVLSARIRDVFLSEMPIDHGEAVAVSSAALPILALKDDIITR